MDDVGGDITYVTLKNLIHTTNFFSLWFFFSFLRNFAWINTPTGRATIFT